MKTRFLGCISLLIALSAGAQSTPKKSVAVLPLKSKNKASQAVTAVLDDLLLNAIQESIGNTHRVIGQSDVDAALGFERTKDMVGCDDLSCAAEIAGALGVDTIIYGNFSKLGSKYFLSLAWLEQQTGTSLGRASASIGTTEDDFPGGLRAVVGKLFGTRTQTPPPPANNVPPPSTGRLDDLSSWIQKSGTWYAKDGAIYGIGGHLLYREELDNYEFGVTAEHISGPDDGVIGVLSRFSFVGEDKNQGYIVNMLFGPRKLNIFSGLRGAWHIANPNWKTWTFMEQIDPKKNRVVWRSEGPMHRVTLNGRLLYEFVDGGMPRGRPGFNVERTTTLVRFSDFYLKRL